MKTETTLAYLMQLLDVSGKELAVEADTDTTTVSKWRTGKRRLAAESGACRAVAAFFLSSRFAVRGAELNSFMEGLVSGFSDMDAGKRLEAMCYVLSRPRLMGASAAGEGLQDIRARFRFFPEILRAGKTPVRASGRLRPAARGISSSAISVISTGTAPDRSICRSPAAA